MRLAALIVAIACGTATAQPGFGVEPRRPTPFDRGRSTIYIGAGSESSMGERYFGVGAGYGYHVLDGLELSVGGHYWWGSGPRIIGVTPGVRYVFHPLLRHSPVVPYLGVFASHRFIGDPFVDQDALGARAGGFYVSGNFVLGIGAGIAQYISGCSGNCTSIFPDFTVSLAF